MRLQKTTHRLEVANMIFVISALCKHGRAGEVVAMFEEQLDPVSDHCGFTVAAIVANFEECGASKRNTCVVAK